MATAPVSSSNTPQSVAPVAKPTPTAPSTPRGKAGTEHEQAVLGATAEKKTDVNLKRPLPGYTILVHGVNDVGEAYTHQEAGLCAGLNERLSRADLVPGTYNIPTLNAKIEKDPDAVYFQRDGKVNSHSPVIPFYWGFREVTSMIKPREKHGQLTDRYNNRLDARGIKEGGQFSNACNNLPDMYGPGFDADSLDTFSDKAHPVLECPPRNYMVLAAMRLVALIRAIRLQPGAENDVINLVGHSQGCLVSLLANAMLAQQGLKPVDSLVMNHPPYGLYPVRIENTLRNGGWYDAQQSGPARLNTLKNIVQFMYSKKNSVPAFEVLKEESKQPHGVCGPFFGQKILLSPEVQPFVDGAKEVTYADRDNRGKVYLYFCPEDYTVGLYSQQGIGWQGVPDRLSPSAGVWVGGAFTTPIPALSSLGPGFKQRVFTMKIREGKLVKVGMAPHQFQIDGDWETDWPNRTSSVAKGSRAGPSDGKDRTINAEALAPAFVPQLREGDLGYHAPKTPKAVVNQANIDVYAQAGEQDPGPVDAAIITANDGIESKTEVIDNPLKLTTGPGFSLSSKERKALEDWYNKDVPKDEQGLPDLDEMRYVKDASVLGSGRLRVKVTERPREARARWQKTYRSDNSYHSSIVRSPMHSQLATARDIAVGFAKGHNANPDVLDFFRAMADWRMKVMNVRKFLNKSENPHRLFPAFMDASPVGKDKTFFPALPADIRQLMHDTWIYAHTGELPASVKSAKVPPLVDCQTQKDYQPAIRPW